MFDAVLLSCYQLQSRLKEAEQKQTELDLSRKLLQDTVRQRRSFMSFICLLFVHVVLLFPWQEAELRSLQRRSEQREDVWKNKVSEAEQQNQTVRSCYLIWRLSSQQLILLFTAHFTADGPAVLTVSTNMTFKNIITLSLKILFTWKKQQFSPNNLSVSQTFKNLLDFLEIRWLNSQISAFVVPVLRCVFSLFPPVVFRSWINWSCWRTKFCPGGRRQRTSSRSAAVDKSVVLLFGWC